MDRWDVRYFTCILCCIVTFHLCFQSFLLIFQPKYISRGRCASQTLIEFHWCWITSFLCPPNPLSLRNTTVITSPLNRHAKIIPVPPSTKERASRDLGNGNGVRCDGHDHDPCPAKSTCKIQQSTPLIDQKIEFRACNHNCMFLCTVTTKAKHTELGSWRRLRTLRSTRPNLIDILTTGYLTLQQTCTWS